MRLTGRFEGYNFAKFRKDLVSGVIVGIIAIPLGMAFAIASGVKPEYGLYTTIVAGILISLFGGSKFQIGGPTGAFIPILFAIVMQYGYENLLIAGFMAGIILILMGLFKMGSLIKFIPRPVTIGFTAGIAVIIFSGQIGNFLGLTDMQRHEYFLMNMKEIFMHLSSINIYSVITAVVSLTVILLTPRFLPKVPGALLGLIISAGLAALLFNGKVATIGSAFGAIPNTLPALQFPDLSFERILMLIVPALMIAMLGGIESLLSAVVADRMSGSQHNSNRELIGQGIANVVTPLFGGIPATGAIARTAANINHGAASPMSGVIHGVVVLLILMMFAPFASHIPLASMAPILMVVAWNMSERKEFMNVLKTKSSDAAVLVLTFLLTVLTNLTIAVPAGIVLSILVFIKRMSDSMHIVKAQPEFQFVHEIASSESDPVAFPQLSIYTVEGPLFFGSATTFEKKVMDIIYTKPKVLLLRMGRVPVMDTTGEASFSRVVKHCLDSGGIILIAGIQQQPLQVIKRSGLYDIIQSEHIFERTGEAINYALRLNDQKHEYKLSLGKAVNQILH